MTRISVSNLAWPPGQDDQVRTLLRAHGVQGIEVAPTRLAPWAPSWAEITPALLRRCRDDWAAAGIAVTSLQAILFGVPQAQLLGDDAAFDAMAEHLRHVAEIGHALGAGVAVFGAPRSRLRGGRPADEAFRLATDRMRVLGDILAPAGLRLGIEPVPAKYGCDFLNRAAEVIALVDACAHPAIRVHLDTACVAMAGDGIGEAIDQAMDQTADRLAHFHAAQPDLGRFDTPLPGHAEAARHLAARGYAGWVAIEMREAGADPLGALAEAIAFVCATYGDTRDGAVVEAAPSPRSTAA